MARYQVRRGLILMDDFTRRQRSPAACCRDAFLHQYVLKASCLQPEDSAMQHSEARGLRRDTVGERRSLLGEALARITTRAASLGRGLAATPG